MSTPQSFPVPAVGASSRPVLSEQAHRQQAGRLRPLYEEHEFQVPAGANNLSLKGGLGVTESVVDDHTTDCSCGRANPAAFDVLQGKAQRVLVRNVGGVTLTIRFNSKTADPYTLGPGEIQDWDFCEVEEMFFSAAGGPIPVKVTLS